MAFELNLARRMRLLLIAVLAVTASAGSFDSRVHVQNQVSFVSDGAAIASDHDKPVSQQARVRSKLLRSAADGQDDPIASLKQAAIEPHTAGISQACLLGTYWCDLLVTAGVALVDQAKLTRKDGKWFYNEVSTGVGNGAYDAACNQSLVYCAGTLKYGFGTLQAAAVKEALDNGGRHPNAPAAGRRLTLSPTEAPTLAPLRRNQQTQSWRMEPR